ncbi:MAG TPA: sigma-70 family RNA polymerase sigma factor [Streptosporangiaceae bacterium]|nr:sigma-70 family RNA polymerase sigma factor [Streptosporangiaceae bacterium]
MADSDVLATAFEEHRDHLRAVAYRLLGSVTDAEDAVQDTWLRLTGADSSEIDNLGAWLTTVVARVCLNVLRSRRRHQEDPVGDDWPVAAPAGPAVGGVGPLGDPEEEAVLADSVGLALLVVLDTLSPAERLAFVLHDLFAMPFAEVAEVLGRSVESTRQLASRARRRVRGASSQDRAADLARQHEVASAFLAAARGGDLAALVALLDTDVTLTADASAAPSGRPVVLQGVEAVSRGASLGSRRAGKSELALVDGSVGVVFAPEGKPAAVLVFTVNDERRIAAIDVIADPDRLRRLHLTALSGQ